MGAVEVWLSPNGDFVQTANGDLLLAYDTPTSADATIQRLIRLLTTNARIMGSNGQPISTPGDLFHPGYGASEPAEVGQPITRAFVASLQARILNGLLSDPTIVPVPAPTVVVTQANSATVQVAITATTVTGQSVSFKLPNTSSAAP